MLFGVKDQRPKRRLLEWHRQKTLQGKGPKKKKRKTARMAKTERRTQVKCQIQRRRKTVPGGKPKTEK